MKKSEKILSMKQNSTNDGSLWYLYAALEPAKWLKCYTDLIELNERRKQVDGKKNSTNPQHFREPLFELK
ncbi:MAG: hypothetical protein ACOY90_13935 [Candidatus Zhuqueibacterota bacterium]